MKGITPMVALLGVALFAGYAYAEWQANGIAVADMTNEEQNCRLVSDDAGGAIVVWQTRYHVTNSPDIYAQRVDHDGNLLWAGTGVAVCEASGGQFEPRIVTDGTGGAIIAWVDFRSANGQIWAQRIDANGKCLWAQNGIPVCVVNNSWGWWEDFDLRMMSCPDGAILVWGDDRTGDFNIYAQRLDLSGTPLWTPNGIVVCAAAGTQQGPRLTSDGAGGAIVAWVNGELYTIDEDIYAQRIASDSTLKWTPAGVNLCTAPNAQYSIDIVTDGESGAYVAWMDQRTDTLDIYMQRIDGDGQASWQADGVSVCTAANQQWNQVLAPDESGGVYATWYDRRNAAARLINDDAASSGRGSPGGWHDGGTYAQHLDANGNSLWVENGITIRDDPSLDNQTQAIIADGYGGAIISWVAMCAPVISMHADRSATRLTESPGVYAQRVGPDGTCFWGEGGVSLTSMQALYPVLTTDGAAGAVVAWVDWPCASGGQGVYAQRVSGNGFAPPTDTEIPPVGTFLAQNYPNPFNPATRVTFALSKRSFVSLRVFDVLGRFVRVLHEGWLDAGSYEERWDGTALDGGRVASGVYLCRLSAGDFAQTRKMILLY